MRIGRVISTIRSPTQASNTHTNYIKASTSLYLVIIHDEVLREQTSGGNLDIEIEEEFQFYHSQGIANFQVMSLNGHFVRISASLHRKNHIEIL